jgi:hypothetical protein
MQGLLLLRLWGEEDKNWRLWENTWEQDPSTPLVGPQQLKSLTHWMEGCSG